MKPVNTPKAVDLFAGCGGLTVGLKTAGFKVLAAVEIDQNAANTFKKNHVDVKVFQSDIRKLSATDFKSELGLKKGQLDLLAGCPPCQGFSSMRTLNGKKRNRDSQNDLIFDFLRFARALRPKTLMMENVPGLAKTAKLKSFIAGLKKIGYCVEYKVLNAADFGVPQRRRRLVLMATRLNRQLSFPPSSKSRTTVRMAFSRLRNRNADELHNYKEKRSQKILRLIKAIPKDGGNRMQLGKRRQLKCHKKIDGFKDVYGRMWWDDVAPTITSGCTNPSKGRFLHPSKNRAITLREASILQTFPLTYKFDLAGGRSGVALMIGNALPPKFIACHAKQLKGYLEGKR